ncbi:hypothetical protein CCR75_006697 [Bremia lactucae]|uniref:PWI domain-containing protein n=1 Tax=Bremia lactucae TaxID=4779 RepID=A0A976NZV7_BRELC|nr:hypothetical protein CCR75_006697 [Bremia lactucae]
MVGNKKNMEQIAHDLVDFIGDESADQFVAWLSQLLPKFEAQAAESINERSAEEVSKPQVEEATMQEEQASETKEDNQRVISLKVLSSSSSEVSTKKTVSLGGNRGTIRSLYPSKTDADDVIARRARRFGVVEHSPTSKKSSFVSLKKEDRHQRDEARSTGNKRRGHERDSGKESGGRLSQRLGPPVNIDQAELDARDTLGGHKKQRGDHDEEYQHGGGRQNRRKDRFDNVEDVDKKGRQRNDGFRNDAPPLPLSSDKDSSRGKQGHGQNHSLGPSMGFQNGPMGFGVYPPPYGGPMFYPPPGYGPMNTFAMGFPPQGMPPYDGRSYPHPMQAGPHGNRPFQNRTWVNPNVVKAEAAKDNENQPVLDATEDGAGGSNSVLAPRNPFYSSQMRPRFQNKTWVRQDTAKDEELSSSLPKTPPRELLESTD